MENWVLQRKASKRGTFVDYGDKLVVKLGKDGITFSEKFCQVFGFADKGCVNVFYDERNQRLGFRLAINAADQDAGYKLGSFGNSKKTLRIGCTKVINKLGALYMDQVYEATTVGTIIGIDLNHPESL